MRKAFKSQIKINCRRLPVLFFYQVMGFNQSFFLQPLPGRCTERFLKITFERCQAAACQLRKLFNGYIEMVIRDHELLQVYLMWLGEIKQEVF